MNVCRRSIAYTEYVYLNYWYPLILKIKSMQSKSLLIALAAFAVTTTGAQAYVGSKALSRAGFSTEQAAAFDSARALRREGNTTAARDALVDSGINIDHIESLRKEAQATRSRLGAALEANDFTAFRAAVADTPLADLILTETDFAIFREAYERRHAGDTTAAAEQLAAIGRAASAFGDPHQYRATDPPQRGAFGVTSGTPDDALRAARQANDKETVSAILHDLGEELHE